jgi:hypothetical protein
MGSEATLTSSDGKREGHGLSLLDIVKHSVRCAAFLFWFFPSSLHGITEFSSIVDGKKKKDNRNSCGPLIP